MKKLKNKYKIIRESLDDKPFDNIQDTKPIVADGLLNSDIMIIGRDLGKNEVLKERPLIGKSGLLFRSALVEISMLEVYMTNLVPYKPEHNNAFSKEIIDKFKPLLRNQIEMNHPKIIIPLGKNATKTVLNNKSISGLKNFLDNYYGFDINLKPTNNILSCELSFEVSVFPIIHPSYFIMRGINANNISEKIKEDDNYEFMEYFYNPLLKAKQYLKEL